MNDFSFSDARTLIDRYRLQPKRSLGQNFIVDDHHLEYMLAAADLTADDTVLEIGPGLGTLTRLLSAQAGRVVAVELDDRLMVVLEEELADLDNVSFVHDDILKTDPAALVKLTSDNRQLSTVDYKVVANLPYYITSAVLRHLLEADLRPERVVVLVQKEVAERICASPGQMSILSVAVQFYAQPSLVHHVPAAAFYPRPKVDSAVLKLDVYDDLPLADVEPKRFFQIVRAGFGQKRKQLLNSLSAGLSLPKSDVITALTQADIDPKRRAQTLSLAEWREAYLTLVGRLG